MHAKVRQEVLGPTGNSLNSADELSLQPNLNLKTAKLFVHGFLILESTLSFQGPVFEGAH